MVDRAIQIGTRNIKPATFGGAAVVALLLLLIFGTLAAVALRAEGASQFRPSDWAALRFTLWQAFFSATISVALAIPVARALARQRFPGRGILITLLGAPFILPVLVAVLGLLTVFGGSGWLNAPLRAMGLPGLSIYGAWGVVTAHVFFNLPLATRLILQAWQGVPAAQFRLAATLGAGAMAHFRLIELPLLKRVLPGAFLLIFLICLTSFAVALTLGGGPKATTLELAIYQAFLFEFDLGKAARLAALQFVICAGFGALVLGISLPEIRLDQRDAVVQRFDAQGARVWDGLAILLAAIFLIAPLLAIVFRGVPFVWGLPPSVWWAAVVSVVLALASAALCLVLAGLLAFWLRGLPRLAGRLGEGLAILTLATSPLVIGTGLFLLIFPLANPQDWALVVTFVVNALMSLPFALRVILPALNQSYLEFERLAQSLNMGPWAWARLVLLPRMRPSLGFAAALTAAMAMGDLGIIALFADPDVQTLPLALYRLMGAYRMDDAAGAAVLLLALALSIFYLLDKGGRWRA